MEKLASNGLALKEICMGCGNQYQLGREDLRVVNIFPTPEEAAEGKQARLAIVFVCPDCGEENDVAAKIPRQIREAILAEACEPPKRITHTVRRQMADQLTTSLMHAMVNAAGGFAVILRERGMNDDEFNNKFAPLVIGELVIVSLAKILLVDDEAAIEYFELQARLKRIPNGEEMMEFLKGRGFDVEELVKDMKI